ncbi:MAG: hypothetical protein F4213_21640 [Boseongicola sp. SB0677_bin_26]|nr:hypothetical protein [Boseongicola sp. SB0665_bin_10]MYG28584.1 hypothetical protein [Boseongicola sp. SB0677_bin_26]
MHATRKFLQARALISLAALCLVAAAPAAWSSALQLGIDCDKPVRNKGGWFRASESDEIAKDRCEAFRDWALYRTNVVMESTERLVKALDTLPPPLLDSLKTHLQSDDDLDDWSWSDAGVEALLVDLAARAVWFKDPLYTVRAYQAGIVDGATFGPEWHEMVQAKMCGTNPWKDVIVWLDRRVIELSELWTPETVRRVQINKARTSQWHREEIGKVVDRASSGGPPDLVFVDGRNRETPLDACFDVIDTGTHREVLAMMFRTSSREGDWGERRVPCQDPGHVGYKRLRWEQRNGVYIQPEGALPDPSLETPGAGGILNVTRRDDALQLVEDKCRVPKELFTRRSQACTDASEDGVVMARYWYREIRDGTNGMEVRFVPVNPDGTLAITEHQGEVLSTTCNDPGPIALDLTPTETCKGYQLPGRHICEDWFGNESCLDEHGSAFQYGKRRFWQRVIMQGQTGPIRDVRVRTVTDHCFDLERTTGSQSRTGSECEVVPTTQATSTGTVTFSESVRIPKTRQIPDPDWVAPSPCGLSWDPLSGVPDPNDPDCGQTAPLIDEDYLDSTTVTQSYTDTDPNAGPCECPAGWSGSITQERDFKWFDRDWAINGQNPSGRFALDDIASWWDGATAHSAMNPGEKRVYGNMHSELVSRPGWPSPKAESDPLASEQNPTVYTVWLEKDWHVETNTCTPPAPSSSSDGDSDSPWGHRSYLDGQIYERPAADGTSRGVNQNPTEHGAAPSAPDQPGDYDFG